MATFVMLEPDAFNVSFNRLGKGLGRQNREDKDGISRDQVRAALYHHVRRPVRGIQIKDDTYATLFVRDAAGTNIPLFDAASETNTGKGAMNSNFILQSVQEQRAEKQQIILTFGEPYIFFFGEQPRMITVSGVLLNTEDFNWRAEWWQNYDLFLRGTQCVRRRTRVYLSWDDIVVEGYVITANASEDSQNQNVVSFQFQMFLTNYQNISDIGGIDAHWHGKDINLNPDTIDLPGNGYTSKLELGRSRNLISEQLAAGENSKSLFDFLRKGDLNNVSTRLVALQGQLVDFLSVAGQFVSGRNIRVPIGFEGAAAFDSEVQFAIASIPGASAVTGTPTKDRILNLKTGGLNLVPEFRATLNSKFGHAEVGKHLSANTDEFVARMPHSDPSAYRQPSIDPNQLTDDEVAMQKVRDVYEELGVKIDPPSDLTRLFRRTMFGIVSLGAGMNLADSSSLRSGLNTVGTFF